MMGIEPTIFRFEVGRLIHWATRPMKVCKHFGYKYASMEEFIALSQCISYDRNL